MLGIEPEKKKFSKKFVYIIYLLLGFYMSRWLSGENLTFLGNSRESNPEPYKFQVKKFFEKLNIKTICLKG